MATQPAPQSWQPMSQPQGMPPGQPVQTQNSMAPHVKVVAIIDLVFAGLTTIAALAIIFGLGVGRAAVADSEQYGTPSWVANMLGTLAIIMGVIFVGVALLYAFAGFRLLSWRRSGKGLGVASAIVQIIVGIPTILGAGIGLIPLGAGIYGLVILMNAKTDQLLVNP